jgi:hypothetical protein
VDNHNNKSDIKVKTSELGNGGEFGREQNKKKNKKLYSHFLLQMMSQQHP